MAHARDCPQVVDIGSACEDKAIRRRGAREASRGDPRSSVGGVAVELVVVGAGRGHDCECIAELKAEFAQL